MVAQCPFWQWDIRDIDDDDKEFEEVAEEFTVGGGGGESLSLANSRTHDTPMDDFDF